MTAAEKIRRHYANVVATVALVAALTGGAAWAVAGKNTVGKPQIKANAVGKSELRSGAVKSLDIGKNTIRAADVATGAVAGDEIAPDAVGGSEVAPDAVGSDAIAPGAVGPGELDLPGPAVFQSNAQQTVMGDGYSLAAAAGTVDKVAADSVLRVDWSGVAQAGFSPCTFQLRVDGQAGSGAGEVYVQNSTIISVSAGALFTGLAPGAHQVEVWARATSGDYPCTLSPGEAGVTQTVIAQELIL